MRAPLTISWPVRGFQSVLFCIDQSEALMDHTPNENKFHRIRAAPVSYAERHWAYSVHMLRAARDWQKRDWNVIGFCISA